MIDFDAEAEALLSSQGLDPYRPQNPELLACCVLGARNVLSVPGLRVPARLRDGVLELNPRSLPRSRRWLCAHELAERHLERLRFASEWVEHAADRLAGAFIAPRPALQLALRAHGRHLPTLAAVFQTTQSVMALRLGEVTGSPLALVTPRKVHVRGEEWAWGSERAVRRLAAGALPATLERLEVTDARARVVLVAA